MLSSCLLYHNAGNYVLVAATHCQYVRDSQLQLFTGEMYKKKRLMRKLQAIQTVNTAALRYLIPTAYSVLKLPQ